MIRTRYGTGLAAEFDVRVLDAIDDDILLAPDAAFADVCWAEAVAEQLSPAPSVVQVMPNRRPVWVHNGFGGSDEDITLSGTLPDADEEDDDCWELSHSTLRNIAPWASPDRVRRPASVLVFRRPSDASSLFSFELPAPKGLLLHLGFDLSPALSVWFAPLPVMPTNANQRILSFRKCK